jgi:hypothetical protein
MWKVAPVQREERAPTPTSKAQTRTHPKAKMRGTVVGASWNDLQHNEWPELAELAASELAEHDASLEPWSTHYV